MITDEHIRKKFAEMTSHASEVTKAAEDKIAQIQLKLIREIEKPGSTDLLKKKDERPLYEQMFPRLTRLLRGFAKRHPASPPPVPNTVVRVRA